MFGRKVTMVPTPPMMPFTTREVTASPAPVWASSAVAPPEIQSMTSSKPPLIQSPTVKVRKKITAMMPRNTGMPQVLLVRTRSARSVSMS